MAMGFLLLPDGEIKQIEVLKRLKEGRIKLDHPIGSPLGRCAIAEPLRIRWQ
jgi:hypothetical protein